MISCPLLFKILIKHEFPTTTRSLSEYDAGFPLACNSLKRPVYGKGSPPLASSAMELITILNRCHPFHGFVYQHAHFSADKESIEVAVRPRKRSTAVCSRCHLPAPGYDQLAERRF